MERQFRRSVDSLAEIFAFAEDYFAREQLDAADLFPVKFSLEELFTNMVKYNPNGPPEVGIGMERAGDALEIVLTDDEAVPFDPSASPDPGVDRPLEERDPGGLGIHLVKKLMDGIEYEHADGRSRIRLVLRLRGR